MFVPLRAAAESGPGVALQVLLVVAIIGIALTAWFLLRGYRDQDGPGDR